MIIIDFNHYCKTAKRTVLRFQVSFCCLQIDIMRSMVAKHLEVNYVRSRLQRQESEAQVRVVDGQLPQRRDNIVHASGEVHESLW